VELLDRLAALVRTLEGFDFKAQPSVDAKQIRELSILPLARGSREPSSNLKSM